MINHPNRSLSLAKVEILAAGQSSARVYFDNSLSAIISADPARAGHWYMRRAQATADGRIELVNDDEINVTGIIHNQSEITRAIRLFIADAAATAVAWPASGLRAACRDAMANLKA